MALSFLSKHFSFHPCAPANILFRRDCLLDLFIINIGENLNSRMIYHIFFFLSLQNLWYRASRYKASSAWQPIGRSTPADSRPRRLSLSIVWRAPATTMDPVAERCVASVTIISGTLPARRAARKFVFPVGKANTARNVSVASTIYLRAMINSFVGSRFIFVFTTSFLSSITMGHEEQSLKFKYQSLT